MIMEMRSSFADVKIPEDISLADFVLSHIIKYGDRPCMIDDITGRVVSYAQFVSDCYKFAAGMYSRGLRPGDKVAVCALNCIQYPVIFYGIQLCRATFVGIIPFWTIYCSKPLFEEANPCFVFTTAEFLSVVNEATSDCRGIKEILLIGDSVDGHATFEDILDNSFEMPVLQHFPKTDIASILYTSGSTGQRKAVMKSQHNLISAAKIYEGAGRKLYTKSDHGICHMSRIFSHAWAHTEHFVFGFYHGILGIILPDNQTITVANAVEKYRINYLVCPPLELMEMARLQCSLGTSVNKFATVETVTCSGMPMLDGIPEKAFLQFSGLTHIYNLLGMTEAGVVTITDITRDNFKSGGCLLPNVKAKIMDPDTLHELGSGERGELWVRSPCVCHGYLNRPQETAEALIDGWLRTGDILFYDEKQSFFVVDRMKQMIKYGDIPISPSELEAVIMKLPSVVEVAVVGIPDSVYGELPRAFVLKKPGSDLTEDQVKDIVIDHLSETLCPHGGVQFVDDLPKSETGKILRREVKAKYVE